MHIHVHIIAYDIPWSLLNYDHVINLQGEIHFDPFDSNVCQCLSECQAKVCMDVFVLAGYYKIRDISFFLGRFPLLRENLIF